MQVGKKRSAGGGCCNLWRRSVHCSRRTGCPEEDAGNNFCGVLKRPDTVEGIEALQAEADGIELVGGSSVRRRYCWSEAQTMASCSWSCWHEEDDDRGQGVLRTLVLARGLCSDGAEACLQWACGGGACGWCWEVSAERYREGDGCGTRERAEQRRKGKEPLA